MLLCEADVLSTVHEKHNRVRKNIQHEELQYGAGN